MQFIRPLLNDLQLLGGRYVLKLPYPSDFLVTQCSSIVVEYRTATPWVPDSITAASWDTVGLMLDICFMLSHKCISPHSLCLFPCLLVLGACLCGSDVKLSSSVHLLSL